MKRFLVVLSMALFMGVFAVQAQDKPKDWAGFGHYAEQNAEILKSGKAVDAVFMGNSITRGWVREDAKFFEENNFVGRGISGQTTAQMVVRFRRDVIDLKPRVVVIMAGINDLAQNNGYISKENILGNIESMCDLARANKIKVILCSITPSSQFPWRKHITTCAEDIAEVNSMIKAYAEQNDIYYLDYYSALVNDNGGMQEQWTTDGVHLKKACYGEVMEPMVLKAINKVLRTKKSYTMQQ